MNDLRRNGLNNQKRDIVAAVFRPTEADILANAYVADLPERVLIVGVETIVHTASGTVGAQATVKVGATDIATDVAVDSTGTKTTATPGEFETGGAVTIVAGTTAPATGSLDAEFVIRYIELDTTTGEYVG